MIRVAVLPLFALLVLSACAGPASGEQQSDPKKIAELLSGDAASSNPLCTLFTRAEVAKYIGQPVDAGTNAALGTGCQWVATDADTGDVIVSVSSERHERPDLAPGYKALGDVGKDGFVAPQLDGWVAGTIVGDKSFWVSVAGSAANEATAVAVLKETMKRYGRK